MHHLWPLSFLPGDSGNGFGWLLLVAALGLGAAAAWEMKSARTHLHVHKPATLILSSGPFAYSRNPIYLGMVAVVVAVACIFNSLWVLLLAAPAALALQKFAIEPEERYLEGKFGALSRLQGAGATLALSAAHQFPRSPRENKRRLLPIELGKARFNAASFGRSL